MTGSSSSRYALYCPSFSVLNVKLCRIRTAVVKSSHLRAALSASARTATEGTRSYENELLRPRWSSNLSLQVEKNCSYRLLKSSYDSVSCSCAPGPELKRRPGVS
jgi:hypothetical protein